MKILELFGRSKRSTPARSGEPARDWSAGWTQRDWADLPTHHPRRDEA